MSTASGTYSMRQISSCHPFHHASPGCGPGIINVLNFRIFKVRQHCCHPLCDMPHYQSPTWVQRPKPTPHAESRRTIRFTMRRLAVALQSETSSIFAFSKSRRMENQPIRSQGFACQSGFLAGDSHANPAQKNHATVPNRAARRVEGQDWHANRALMHVSSIYLINPLSFIYLTSLNFSSSILLKYKSLQYNYTVIFNLF